MKLIFVFGSNEAGIHGAGAARYAHEHYAARYGQGFGPSGLSFAIPTKDWRIETLPYETIQHYVERFVVYARLHRDDEFKVTALGTGLAGLRHDVVAPMFKHAPENCSFDTDWHPWLTKHRMWGHW